MKANRKRYQYQISEESYNDIVRNVSETALEDGAKQGVAVCLMACEMALGWRSARLRRLYDAVQDMLDMPDVFGKSPTAAGAIARMRDFYGIDVDSLEIKIDVEGQND